MYGAPVVFGISMTFMLEMLSNQGEHFCLIAFCFLAENYSHSAYPDLSLSTWHSWLPF